MLRCRPRRVVVIPIGGLIALAGLLGLGIASPLVGSGDRRLWITLAVLGLGVAVHVLTSFALIRREGERLRWRALFVRGEALAKRCRLVTEVDARPGHGATLELSLLTDTGQTLTLASLPASDKGQAQLRAIADALELDPP